MNNLLKHTKISMSENPRLGSWSMETDIHQIRDMMD